MIPKKHVPIKVGFLISYDWYLLKNALPFVYKAADAIYLAIDKKRITWSGNPFEIDEVDFQNFIKGIDSDKKIQIYEDDFYVSSFSPIQCEVRERNLLAKAMGKEGWHIQLDVDEYFINFTEFAKYLQKIPFQQKEINISVLLLNLFKKTANGYLYILDTDLNFSIQVATNKPFYEYGRRNGYFNHLAPFYMLHDTWSRSEEEIWQKINNWGHRDDFDKQYYFNLWKSIDETNYKQFTHFHPFNYKPTQRLEFIPAQIIQELINTPNLPPFPLSKFGLMLRNSRNVARLKHLWSKIMK